MFNSWYLTLWSNVFGMRLVCMWHVFKYIFICLLVRNTLRVAPHQPNWTTKYMLVLYIHGIPRNFEKIPWNTIKLFSGKFNIPWNSVKVVSNEKNSTEFYRILDLNKIPWNSGYAAEVAWNTMEPQTLFVLFEKFHVSQELVPWNFLSKISFNGLWKEMFIDNLICNQWCWKLMWHYATEINPCCKMNSM